MTESDKNNLEKKLWNVADELWGKMNADEYKDYILGFIFYKYLSERLESYVNEELLAKEDYTFRGVNEDLDKHEEVLEAIKKACLEHLGYFLEPTDLFTHVVAKGKGEIENEDTFILEDLKETLTKIERTSAGTESEDDFKGLFDSVDLASVKLGSTEKKKNKLIVTVLKHLEEIDFKIGESQGDLLGDAYEYLIGEFAAGAGKKGGEFYTPSQVSRLVARLATAGKNRVKSVYDPTCGSGSLLLQVAEFADVDSYFGQELNPTTYNLARMNMILHGVHFADFDIAHGDTLTEQRHPELKAEVIVANPPFSAKWDSKGDPVLADDERFSQYGRLAPKSYADYAFVTHMLYHLADNGQMAVVLPHGALFRSGAEGEIRQYIIEKQNYLDAVIGLPENLFYGTSIPATVMVFKKCREDDENILFINASQDYEDGSNQNHLLDEHLDKIFETYREREEVEKYAHLASVEEIEENDFNLNIPRYVDTFEEEEPIDIAEVADELESLQAEEADIKEKIGAFCEELEIDKPF
jgi:type I restriction enzyme M protein